MHAIGGEPRPGQREMARAVDSALSSGQHLLVQAGTGTGKSLAYLVPALLHAQQQERPVVVSTATLALQAQLMDRDLPRLAQTVEQHTGRPMRWATLKGRGNYACLHRVRAGAPSEQGELVSGETLASEGLGAEVVAARSWAEAEATSGGAGDRDRLSPGVSDRAWAQVSVSSRECLTAAKCPYGTECFAERAKVRARESDVVVTNHVLLAIDAIEGIPLLPEHDAVVVDEGHELVARVTSSAAAELSSATLERAGKRAASLVDPGDLLAAADGLRRALEGVPATRLDPMPTSIVGALREVSAAARAMLSELAGQSDGTDDPAGQAMRKTAQAGLDEVFTISERLLAGKPEDVAWLQSSDRFAEVLRVAPLSVAGLIAGSLLARRTVVLTSATLKLGGSFDTVVRGIGLGEEHPWAELDVGSPFDYGRQGVLYVAHGLPKPGRDGPDPELLDELGELIEAAGGRTLGLFSSRRGAQRAAEVLRDRLATPVLLQGEDLVPTLVRKFLDDPAASLFGTLSLWQGVDVPGPSCTLVVIDRIPFPRPDDPLMSARQRAVAERGGNGFMAVAATHAALLLAQGSGRLIRSTADRGVVAVLDPRLATARYGSFLRDSMPPMWATADKAAVLAALRRLDESARQAAVQTS